MTLTLSREAWIWGKGPGSYSCCYILTSYFPPAHLIFTEDEDSEGPGSGENRLQHSPNQSYLCIPFPRGEDGDGPSSDGAHEEPTPVNSATSTPQLTPTNSLKRGGTHHRRCEVALLGCGAVLAATGLGFDLLEAGKCQLPLPEESEPPAREEKKRREGLFQRASRPRRSTSPPSRKLFKKEEPMLLLGDPSASLTLLSLSSISECNSTRSLLRSDSDEIVVYEMPVSPVEAPPLTPCTHNPLVNVRVERFKRDPKQSLTPTHVTLTAPTQPSGHRRTPSDGALKPAALVASRSPSTNGLSPSPGAGGSCPPPLSSFLCLWLPQEESCWSELHCPSDSADQNRLIWGGGGGHRLSVLCIRGSSLRSRRRLAGVRKDQSQDSCGHSGPGSRNTQCSALALGAEDQSGYSKGRGLALLVPSRGGQSDWKESCPEPRRGILCHVAVLFPVIIALARAHP